MNDISQLVNATVLVEICSFFIFFYLIYKFCWPLILKNLDERSKLLKEGMETVALVKEKLKETEELFKKRIEEADKIISEKDKIAELARKKMYQEEKLKLELSFNEMKKKSELEIYNAIKKAKEDLMLDITDVIIETVEVFLNKNGWQLSGIDSKQIEDALSIVSNKND